MTKNKFNALIDEIYDLGNSLIFDKFCFEKFETYRSKISTLSENGLKICRDPVQLKTCMLISSKTVEDYRLSLFEQIFFSHGKGTKVNTKNTDEQMRRRLVLITNNHLPILKQKV